MPARGCVRGTCRRNARPPRAMAAGRAAPSTWPSSDGRPVAMAVARGKKEDCEVSEGRALLADPAVQLADALVTADPLHNKQATVEVILNQGGDDVMATKENTSRRLAGAKEALRGTPLLP